MLANEALTQETFNEDDYDELWKVIMITKGTYELSKNQARLVQDAMARGERGAIVFESFTIPIPYIAEFYREKKFLKNTIALPAQATEPEYKPISPDKLKTFREEIYQKLGKPIPK